MTNQRRIIELLNGGDWACAYKERSGLADVCGMLATLVGPELSDRAWLVARLAGKDMRAATKQWAELATLIRHPLGNRRTSVDDGVDAVAEPGARRAAFV